MAARRRMPMNPRAGFQKQEEPLTGVHPQMIKQGRKSGNLNLSNRSLTTVPDTVWRINIDAPEGCDNIDLNNSGEQWWEQEELTKLNLSSNFLTSLSEDIKLLPALTVLDVYDNQLTGLPNSIGELTNLQKLCLGHNKLTELPAILGRLSNLRSLRAEDNKITALEDSFCRLQSLNEVNLSSNEISRLPENLGYLNKLSTLDLSKNKITELPSEIGSLKSLRTLDLTYNQLSSIPDEMGYLRELQQLYLRHNRLSHLPVLTHCTSLKELHVGNNNIKDLTKDHLEHLKAVSVLDVRDNKISVLPDEIILLQGLERLDLTNNNLTTLPYIMGTLPNVQSIVLDGNPMKGIRRDIIMRGTRELQKYLRSRIQEPVPKAEQSAPASGVRSASGASGIIGGGGEGVNPHDVQSSKTLDYSEKRVSKLPDDLWELAENIALQSINLSKNTLTEWPEKMALASQSLLFLNLGLNRISCIPSQVGQFKKLTSLDVRNNMLTDLPVELGECTTLRELVIAFNRFRAIPQVVYTFKKLENFLASDNKIESIDAQGIHGMTMLASLDLQNNEIRTIPPEIGNCTQLRSVQLSGNAFRQPRPAILAKGTDALLEYLRGRIPT